MLPLYIDLLYIPRTLLPSVCIGENSQMTFIYYVVNESVVILHGSKFILYVIKECSAILHGF